MSVASWIQLAEILATSFEVRNGTSLVDPFLSQPPPPPTSAMGDVTKTLVQTAVQDSHIIRHPSPSRDIAPATSADRPPVSIIRDALPSIQFSSSRVNLHELTQKSPVDDIDEHEHEQEEMVSQLSHDDSPAPSSPPKRQRPPLPPIPDLRFEQAYLKQLEAAKGSVFWIIIITLREQVLFPGVQGFLWALGMAGIRTLRTRQAESGREWGSWIRDWFGQLSRTDTTMMGSRKRS